MRERRGYCRCVRLNPWPTLRIGNNFSAGAVMDSLLQMQHALACLSEPDRVSIANWLRELMEGQHRTDRVAEPRSAYAEPLPSFMTADEYLQFEEHSSDRHEFVNGYIYAMSGVSMAHARIARELFVATVAHLRGKPCEAFSTDLKLLIRSDTDEIYYYPDLMVACEREHWGSNYVRNPKLVAEILSPSTQHIDRREKAMAYRHVASVEEYILLAQDEMKVIVQRRAENWHPREYSGPQEILDCRSIGLSVPLAQLYAGAL